MLKGKLQTKNLMKIKIALLVACVLGVGGSYASFSSTLNYNADINFEMGKIDSEFLDGENQIPFNIEGIMPGETREDSFIFRNSGTLNQKLQLKFDVQAEDIEFLNLFNYEFMLKNISTDETSKIYSGTISDLIGENYINILNDSDENLILEASERAEFIFKVSLQDEVLDEYSNKAFTFDLSLLSTQVNDK
ncbi:MAG: TasA family protein [Sarcina sp.]